MGRTNVPTLADLPEDENLDVRTCQDNVEEKRPPSPFVVLRLTSIAGNLLISHRDV